MYHKVLYKVFVLEIKQKIHQIHTHFVFIYVKIFDFHEKNTFDSKL